MTSPEDRIARWIVDTIGGTVLSCERQSRWRGGWWVRLEKDGGTRRLYVREERKEDFPPWPIEHEAQVISVLERHGVPVPHVYGICPDPHAIVMDALDGDTAFASEPDDAARRAVVLDYAEAVARQHAIDPAELVALGMKMPETPDEISLGCLPVCEAIYERGKRIPDPRIAFLRRWIRRNVPRHRRKVSILAVDSGQFLHAGGKVTGLFDFEYGSLGDPLIDLASIPGRIGAEGWDEVAPFFARYAELTGDDLDPAVIMFHRAWWGLCTPLIVAPNLHSPSAEGTFFEYIAWYASPLLGVLLAVSDIMGVDLERGHAIPEERPSRWSGVFDVLARRLPERQADEAYAVTEQRKFVELMRRMDAQRDIEADYIAEASALVGQPLADWRAADAAMERFVEEAGPEHDERLLRLFHRWAQEQAATLIDGINPMYYLHKPFPSFRDLVPGGRDKS